MYRTRSRGGLEKFVVANTAEMLKKLKKTDSGSPCPPDKDVR